MEQLPAKLNPPPIDSQPNGQGRFSESTSIHLNVAIHTMNNYILRKGMVLPEEEERSIEEMSNKEKRAKFNQLSNIIKPATWESIHYINHRILPAGENNRWYEMPILSKCFLISIAALTTLIGISLSEKINDATQNESMHSLAGMELFVILIFNCSAALLGVMFYLLKSMNDKISNYTLLPIDELELNNRIILGLIAGFVISQLFNLPTDINDIKLKKMTIAFLGGYYADTIFQFLNGIIERIKLFGNPI